MSGAATWHMVAKSASNFINVMNVIRLSDASYSSRKQDVINWPFGEMDKLKRHIPLMRTNLHKALQRKVK